MENIKAIERTESYIRQKFEGESSGHDWWHIDNVRKNALLIGMEEGADLYMEQFLDQFYKEWEGKG